VEQLNDEWDDVMGRMSYLFLRQEQHDEIRKELAAKEDGELWEN